MRVCVEAQLLAGGGGRARQAPSLLNTYSIHIYVYVCNMHTRIPAASRWVAHVYVCMSFCFGHRLQNWNNWGWKVKWWKYQNDKCMTTGWQQRDTSMTTVQYDPTHHIVLSMFPDMRWFNTSRLSGTQGGHNDPVTGEWRLIMWTLQSSHASHLHDLDSD